MLCRSQIGGRPQAETERAAWLREGEWRAHIPVVFARAGGSCIAACGHTAFTDS